MAFHPNGNQLLTGSDDNTARLWDLSSGEEVQRFEGHSGSVLAVAFHPNGNQLLTGSYDNTARLWDLSSGEEAQRFEGHSGSVLAVAFHPNGNQLLTGSDDNTARLWDLSSGEEVQRFEGHSGYVLAVAFHPTKNLVYTVAENPDNDFHIWSCLPPLEEVLSSLNTLEELLMVLPYKERMKYKPEDLVLPWPKQLVLEE